MIIVAIIGILASIALPIYSDYSVRTKMAEVILAASVCRTAVSEVYLGASTAPGAGNWGCEGSTSQFVSSLTTDDNGAVTITVTNVAPAVNGLKIQMVPYVSSSPAIMPTNFGQGINAWRCGPTTTGGVDIRYLPASCRGQ